MALVLGGRQPLDGEQRRVSIRSEPFGRPDDSYLGKSGDGTYVATCRCTGERHQWWFRSHRWWILKFLLVLDAVLIDPTDFL